MQRIEGNVVFSFGKMHIFLITRYIMSFYNWIFFDGVVKEFSIFQFALLSKIPIFFYTWSTSLFLYTWWIHNEYI